MRRHGRLSLFTVLLLLVSPLIGQAGTRSEGARLRSIRSDFSQEKHLKILVRPLVSSGRLCFQTPGSLRWEYFEPVASVMLLHDGVMKKHVQRDGQWVAAADRGLDAMQFVLAEISGWLDGRFADNEVFSVARPDEQTVLLTPRGEGMAAVISAIELKLADHAGLLDQVTIFEGPDSRTVLRFSQRVLNEDIPAATFTAP